MSVDKIIFLSNTENFTSVPAKNLFQYLKDITIISRYRNTTFQINMFIVEKKNQNRIEILFPSIFPLLFDYAHQCLSLLAVHMLQ